MEGKLIFEIALSESPVLNKYREIIQMPMSNAAYLFFKNLSEIEKIKYSSIRVAATLSNGETIKNSYSCSDLAVVLKKVNFTKRFVELINEKKISTITTLIEGGGKVNDKRVKNFLQFEADKPPIRELLIYGFRFYDIGQRDERRLHISGVLRRYSLNNEFGIDVSLQKDEVHDISHNF
jgi:hypothetical protein